MMTVNSNHRRRCSHFTLVEIMIATAIMGFITYALMNLYLFPFRIWQINTANFVMAVQGKIIREKILSGVRTDAGLRAAMMNSLVISSEHTGQTDRLDYRMDTQLPPTLDLATDDLTCSLRFTPGVGLVYQSPAGSGTAVPLSRQVKDILNITNTLNNNVLTTQFTMQYNGMFNNKITIPVLIETYITNP